MKDDSGFSFIVFGAPQIEEAEIDEVVECLRSGWIGTGPRVARFETDFALYKGLERKQVAAVYSCTAALHLSLVACGLEPGDEVITTPLTFCATVNAIVHAGLTPVLADVDPSTQNIDPAAIEAAITPRTRAIVPVHFAGYPCDMERIMAIAEKHGLKVIEDCAHAIETEYRGRKAGNFGEFGCFSFYVTKNLATGEGGMVIAKRPQDIDRVKMLALHGMDKDAWKRYSDSGYKHYQVIATGFKYNMMDLQAALGVHQLARLESNWKKREALWNTYQDAFSDLPVVRPKNPEADIKHGYHLYTLHIDEKRSRTSRDRFLGAMHQYGVGTGVHYLSIPEHAYYRERFGWRLENYPHAVRIGRQTASLPFSAKLSGSEIDRVIDAVRKSILAAL